MLTKNAEITNDKSKKNLPGKYTTTDIISSSINLEQACKKPHFKQPLMPRIAFDFCLSGLFPRVYSVLGHLPIGLTKLKNLYRLLV